MDIDGNEGRKPCLKHPFSIVSELWSNQKVWALCGLVFSIKCLLIRCYHSTDFEVHRNWMAITHHLAISQWYHADHSEWTLDYPPFFAYFEKFLSIFADWMDPKMLNLQSTPYLSQNVLMLQRSSVIIVDFLYVAASIVLAECAANCIDWVREKHELRFRLKFGLFCALLLNPGLILIDNIHFQYNGFLYALLFFCVSSVMSGRLLSGAFLFAVLLNFKHIYLYYVPAFVFYYMRSYLWPVDRNVVHRVLKLSSVLMLPVICAFGPFAFRPGGVTEVQQILSRLFPFQRGLTHAYWAPNFWSIYNFADFCLFKCVAFFVKIFDWECDPRWLKCPLAPPLYTQGLVMEYEHSILPNISPSTSLLMIVVSMAPVAAFFFFFAEEVKQSQRLLVAMTLSSFGFFLFGWHVHEKACLMMLLPMTVLVLMDIRFLDSFMPLCSGSLISLLPLLFTPLENLVKYSLTGAYLLFVPATFFYVFRIKIRKLVTDQDGHLFLLLCSTEIYRAFVHKLIFRGALPFLPLMLLSVICSYAIALSYCRLLYILFGQHWQIRRAIRKCLRDEGRILMNKEMVDPFIEESNIKLVGGVDISACPENNCIAMVSYTVLKYPELEVVFTADEMVFLKVPYIPEFLACREATAMAQTVRDNCNTPKPDLVFIDGNGSYHSRLCGLARHVGYLSKTKTIGVAKNWNGFPLISFGFSETDVRALEERIKRKLKAVNKAAVLELDAVVPGLLNVVRAENSSSLLYVSAGYDMDLSSATTLATHCFASSSIYNPIRLSDLRSRALLHAFAIS